MGCAESLTKFVNEQTYAESVIMDIQRDSDGNAIIEIINSDKVDKKEYVIVDDLIYYDIVHRAARANPEFSPRKRGIFIEDDCVKITLPDFNSVPLHTYILALYGVYGVFNIAFANENPRDFRRDNLINV